jgi:hypothetical protein
MKVQKKWVAVFIITGLGGLFFSQSFHKGSKIIGKPSKIAMGNIEKKPLLTAKVDTSKTPSPIKTNDDSHINLVDITLEVIDEMEYFDDSNTGMHIKEHFDQMENTDSDAQERQDESMEEMRREPDLYAEKLFEAYEEVARKDYLSKYKIVYMMENIHSSNAVPFFTELAVSDFPEEIEPYKGDGHIDEKRQESLLRMRAVGGLYALASEGDEKARNALMDTILKSKIQTVKNDAIWAYLSTSENIDTEKEYLKTILPEKDHPFITVKLTNIEDVEEMLEEDTEYEQ